MPVEIQALSLCIGSGGDGQRGWMPAFPVSVQLLIQELRGWFVCQSWPLAMWSVQFSWLLLAAAPPFSLATPLSPTLSLRASRGDDPGVIQG